MHLDIICKLTVTQEIGQRPKLCTNKSDGSGMMVDPSAHPQHMNGIKHLVDVHKMCIVDIETIPCEFGASTNQPCLSCSLTVTQEI